MTRAEDREKNERGAKHRQNDARIGGRDRDMRSRHCGQRTSATRHDCGTDPVRFRQDEPVLYCVNFHPLPRRWTDAVGPLYSS